MILLHFYLASDYHLSSFTATSGDYLFCFFSFCLCLSLFGCSDFLIFSQSISISLCRHAAQEYIRRQLEEEQRQLEILQQQLLQEQALLLVTIALPRTTTAPHLCCVAPYPHCMHPSDSCTKELTVRGSTV